MTTIPKIIAVDFDGTLCEDAWPEIGEPVEWLIQALCRAQECGCAIILWTCREGDALQRARSWCASQGLFFDAENDNLPAAVDLFHGSNTRKIYADIYVDDRAAKLESYRERLEQLTE